MRTASHRSRLGGKRWSALHRLIYFSASAGVIHFIWLVKADLRRPLTYGAVLAALLAYRAAVWAIAKTRRAADARKLEEKLAAN